MKISVLKKISVALSVLVAALPFQTAWADSAAYARANRQEQDRIAHCLQVYGKLKYTLPHRHGVYFGEAREYDENGRLRLVKRYDDKGERVYLREYP